MKSKGSWTKFKYDSVWAWTGVFMAVFAVVGIHIGTEGWWLGAMTGAALGMFVFMGTLVYLAPSIVAFQNHYPDAWGILLLNVVFGWTVIGWIVLLVGTMIGVAAMEANAARAARQA